jgi:hypothetical protein
LKEVLGQVLRDRTLGIQTIVDFGAGNLKNEQFMLSYGKDVTAVEFKKTSYGTIARENLGICMRYGSTFTLMDPEQFVSDGGSFDMALLANVVQTVPLASERMSIMKLLHQKLEDSGYLLWFAQKHAGSYKERMAAGKTCEDGVWMGDGRPRQTFYRYFTPEEAVTLAHDSGFIPFSRFRPQTNYALLFRKG